MKSSIGRVTKQLQIWPYSIFQICNCINSHKLQISARIIQIIKTFLFLLSLKYLACQVPIKKIQNNFNKNTKCFSILTPSTRKQFRRTILFDVSIRTEGSWLLLFVISLPISIMLAFSNQTRLKYSFGIILARVQGF